MGTVTIDSCSALPDDLRNPDYHMFYKSIVTVPITSPLLITSITLSERAQGESSAYPRSAKLNGLIHRIELFSEIRYIRPWSVVWPNEIIHTRNPQGKNGSISTKQVLYA